MLCGGRRHGVCYEATLLEDVPWDCNIVQNEAFGPVACLFPYKDFKQAVGMCAPRGSLGCAAGSWESQQVVISDISRNSPSASIRT